MEELEKKSYVKRYKTLYFWGVPIDVFTSQYESPESVTIVWKRRNKALDISTAVYQKSDGSIHIPDHEKNRIEMERMKDPMGAMILPSAAIVLEYYPNFMNDLNRSVISGMVRRNEHYLVSESQKFLKIVAP